MKKYIILMLLVLVGSAAFAQFGLFKGITQSQADARYLLKGDSVGGSIDTTFIYDAIGAKADSGNVYTKDQSDAKYVNIGDSVEGYTANEVDVLINQNKQSQTNKVIQSLTGYTYVRSPFGTNSISGTSTMSDGVAYYTLVEVFDTITVDRFIWMMATDTAVYEANNYNGIVLYSYNTTTKEYTEVVRTVNDGDIWKGPHNQKSEKTFTATKIYPGIYAIGAVYNSSSQTTAAIWTTFGAINSSFNLLIDSHLPMSTKTSTNDMPASINASAMTTNGTVYGIIMRGQ